MPEQNSWHFTDNIFKCISVNENDCVLIKIWNLSKFVSQSQIIIDATKPLPEPMMTQFIVSYVSSSPNDLIQIILLWSLHLNFNCF